MLSSVVTVVACLGDPIKFAVFMGTKTNTSSSVYGRTSESMRMRNDVEASSDRSRQFTGDTVNRLLLPAALGIGLLQGCAVGPDYSKPEVQTPDRWHQELTKGLASGEADLRTWWIVLDDPVLEEGISNGLRNFSTVAAAPPGTEDDLLQGLSVTMYSFNGKRYLGGRSDFR